MGNVRKNNQKGPPLPSSRRTTDGATTLSKGGVEPIRHILFPPIPVCGAMNFHLTKFAFSVVAVTLQYLNMYRTVWWLSRPWIKYPVDIDSIDYYLLSYILLMFVIPPAYEAFQHLYWRSVTPLRSFNCALVGFLGITLWCALQFHMVTRISYDFCIFPRQYLGVLLVVYQPIIFVIVYYYEPVKRMIHVVVEKARSINPRESIRFVQSQLKSLYQTLISRKVFQMLQQYFSPCTPRSKVGGSQTARIPRYCHLLPLRYATVQPPLSSNVHPSTAVTFYTLRLSHKQQLVPLKHNCVRCSPNSAANMETAAQTVREEAEVLCADFNARLMDTIAGSAVATFYATILPCFFIRPRGLSVDLVWCMGHALLSGLTFFLLHWQYLLPPAYLDLLHRCALHLGSWQELSPTAHSGYLNWQAWSQLQTYAKGVHVKHIRGLFQAVGASNAAEPGNSSHSRLFFWFSSPTLVTNGLCYTAVVISLGQMCTLEWTFEWYKLLGLAAMSPFALLNLYRLLRNRTILSWVWEDERPIYETIPGSVTSLRA
ncbi:Transmembrane protein 39A [Echinococcus granulosus]|uniref:Transmembrane protein 39a n=1 Tax=Echinococcus granulosus TaxID=6210 RepID=A0A068X083_ECHGR|nr:Transmembrane protein 39A [Echinococcus granulosus]CDS23342.1 transmembrane protein 39a [Echinococcus granulosus]